jgi:lipid II:glycine glycyltransferase (peptidoglycan interpeptide bridge formation enzyme)
MELNNSLSCDQPALERNIHSPRIVPAPESLLTSRVIGGREFSARISATDTDPAWDDFLATNPLGQYQQSSMWARAKSCDGWRPLRVILTVEGQIAGGFQILFRHTRFGLIGYVSKGPVLSGEGKAPLDFLMELLISVAKTNRLMGLMLQPPDQSTIGDQVLTRYRFLPNHLMTVVSATLIINSGGSVDEIMSRLRRTTRLELKRSETRGMKMRVGGERDLPTFFRLMTATCRRQQTDPSPATEAALREIWQAFHPTGRIRLAFAEYENEPVAAAICLCFGDRVTFWKKGWSGAHRERHPNQLVMFDAIRWAQSRGFRQFDCLAMHHDTAVSLLNGRPLSNTQKSARDFFLLGYGGTPVLLPESWVYFGNPVLRFLYQTATTCPWGRTLAHCLAGHRI